MPHFHGCILLLITVESECTQAPAFCSPLHFIPFKNLMYENSNHVNEDPLFIKHIVC